jgi:hypothetical protein
MDAEPDGLVVRIVFPRPVTVRVVVDEASDVPGAMGSVWVANALVLVD